MADSDKTLKLLIELGVIGQQDARAAKQLMDEMGDSQKNLNQSMPENLQQLASGWAGWDKYKNSLDGASEGAEKFSIHGKEMKFMMHQLNELVPGLGKSIEGLTRVITGAGGGFVVLQLAIEAAKIYWDMYEQSVAAAAAKTAASLDSIRSAAAKSRTEMEDFNKAMEAASKPKDAEADKLSRDRALLEARYKARRDLMELDKKGEMDAATTPEQKQAVEDKYKGKASALDSAQEAERLNLIETLVDGLKKDLTPMLAEQARLVTQMESDNLEIKRWQKLGLPSTQATKYLEEDTKKYSDLSHKITEIQTKITTYSGESETAAAIHGVNEFGRKASENRTISKAVMEGLDPASHGARLTDEQRNANAELSKLFAGYSGGIEQMQKIIAWHIEHSTTQQARIDALSNALAALKQRVEASR